MGPVAGSRPVGWLDAEHIASSPGSQRLPLHHAALSVDSAFFGCRVGCELFTDTLACSWWVPRVSVIALPGSSGLCLVRSTGP